MTGHNVTGGPERMAHIPARRCTLCGALHQWLWVWPADVEAGTDATRLCGRCRWDLQPMGDRDLMGEARDVKRDRGKGGQL